MSSTIEKNELSQKIKALDSLTADEKSALIGLLNTRKKYGLVWEEKQEDVEELLREKLPVFTEVKERRIDAKPEEKDSGKLDLFGDDEKDTAPPPDHISDLILAKEHLNTRPERMRLRSTVLRSAIREAAKHEGLLDFIDEPSQDERFEKNKFTWSIQLTLQPQKIEVEIPKDVLIDQDMVVAGRQLIVQEKNRIRYAKTTLELTTIVNKFTHTLCGPYEKVDSAPIIKQNLILFLEEYFGIPETPDALKVIGFEGNKRFWQDFVLNKVLHEYEKIVRKKREIRQPEIETAEWNWPLERAYNEEFYKIEPAEVHSLIPFCNARDASTPERKFIAFLEEHRQYINHWYKNGDSGMEHFSIAYKNGQGKDRLFYVDFVIRFADDTIGLFDTKTLNSDPEMVAKHNALLEYISEQRERFGGKITGGVIIEQGENWVYSVAHLDPKQPFDTYGWKALVPQQYGKMVA
ncbi:MAG: hypothetical protein JW915_08905 [Chitinispirillaceae bacterium]|nr:hypothetical protein [Chitinispirillaceae bacterium]